MDDQIQTQTLIQTQSEIPTTNDIAATIATATTTTVNMITPVQPKPIPTILSPRSLSRQGDIEIALKHLRNADPLLSPLIDLHRPSTLDSFHHPPFLALTKSILYQQLSHTTATSVYTRFLALCGCRDESTILPNTVLSLSPLHLRRIGVSGRKASFLHDLAKKYQNGILSDSAILEMDDKTLFTMLKMVDGIGSWSVHMFMIFSLHRPDVLPVDDLGVRKGVQLLYGLNGLPRPSQMDRLCEKWRPYRSVASWYMWRYVEAKGLPSGATAVAMASASLEQQQHPHQQQFLDPINDVVNFGCWNANLVEFGKYCQAPPNQDLGGKISVGNHPMRVRKSKKFDTNRGAKSLVCEPDTAIGWACSEEVMRGVAVTKLAMPWLPAVAGRKRPAIEVDVGHPLKRMGIEASSSTVMAGRQEVELAARKSQKEMPMKEAIGPVIKVVEEDAGLVVLTDDLSTIATVLQDVVGDEHAVGHPLLEDPGVVYLPPPPMFGMGKGSLVVIQAHQGYGHGDDTFSRDLHSGDTTKLVGLDKTEVVKLSSFGEIEGDTSVSEDSEAEINAQQSVRKGKETMVEASAEVKVEFEGMDEMSEVVVVGIDQVGGGIDVEVELQRAEERSLVNVQELSIGMEERGTFDFISTPRSKTGPRPSGMGSGQLSKGSSGTSDVGVMASDGHIFPSSPHSTEGVPARFGVSEEGWRGVNVSAELHDALEAVYIRYPQTFMRFIDLSEYFRISCCYCLGRILRDMHHAELRSSPIDLITSFLLTVGDLKVLGLELDWLEAHLGRMEAKARYLEVVGHRTKLHIRREEIVRQLYDLQVELRHMDSEMQVVRTAENRVHAAVGVGVDAYEVLDAGLF